MAELSEAFVEHLIARYTPPRTRVEFRLNRGWYTAEKNDNGTFVIHAPYPDTPFDALKFLHECAHVANGDENHKLPEYLYEYQAERTAMQWWRNEGKRVPRAYSEHAKQYIRGIIAKQRRINKRRRPENRVRFKPSVVRWARK